MSINSTFYLDAADLSLATSVYLDTSLSLLAPDGFYGDGTITRQQSAGILLTANDCPSCGTVCGGSIAGSGGTGIYLINLNAGNSVGAIVISFDPFIVPDGVRVTYDGNVYNTLSSPVDGLHESTNATGFTVVGNIGSDCGLTGNITNIPAATEYLYDGTTFNPTGATQSITLNPGDISLGANPGPCVMVIPKVNATPNILNIEALGPCGGTAWNISVACPALLPSFQSSIKIGAPSVPCATAISETYYFAKVHTASDSYVGLYDYVFQDAYGELPLPDGYYLTNNVATPNKTLRVENGIVTGISNCS